MRYPIQDLPWHETRLLQFIGGDLELVPVRIAKVNRLRNTVVLEVDSNSPLFQFVLRPLKILPIRAQGEMQKTRRIGRA